jgi:predicted lipoprotein with Yx(FWY)xxD motif
MRYITKIAIFTKATYLISALVSGAMILAACAPPAATAVVPTTVPQATTASVVTQPPTEAPNPSSPSEAAFPEAVLNIATDPEMGNILVDQNGMTLYIFTKDTADTSNCDADCLKKWPALITLGKPILGDGVDASMVGSATLADGSKIVTYNHMPLYYWYKDFKPGDINGQAVGDVWFVVSPDGKPVGLTNLNTNTNANVNANTNANANNNANDNGNTNSNQNSNEDSGNDNGGGGNDNGGSGNDNGGG